MGDRQTDIFVKLQTALEASRGFLTWADVAWGIQKAIERKKHDSVTGLLSGLNSDDLQMAEKVAFREMAHATATAKASAPAIQVISVADQPDPRTAQKQKATKSKRRSNA